MPTAEKQKTFHYWGRDEPALPDRGGRLPVALVFPQPYPLGLSTLGWQVVYRLLAREPSLVVERFFWDAKAGQCFSRDSSRPLQDFPLVCFSLNFELDCLPMVQALKGAGIPLCAADNPDWPLVMAGGPLAFLNPAPIAPSLDCLFVGEAEAGFASLCRRVASEWFAGTAKKDCLQVLAGISGVLVPGVSELPVGRLIASSGRGLATPGHSCFISSEAQFRDAFLLEVNRGCPYGCRFCAAGFVYRPPRQANVEDLKDMVRSAAPPKVGLVGTALTDWPDLLPFLKWLHARRIKFSLSSLRADGLNWELLEFLRRTGTRTLTLALEGASERLRRAMNKRLSEKRLLEAVATISGLQFNHLKLYLITGWPGETDADLTELGGLLQRIDAAVRQGKGGKGKGLGYLTLSVSCLVPKPWTPLQWAPMAPEQLLHRRLEQIRALGRPIKGFRVEGETPFGARLQGLIARGDASVHDLILQTAEQGGSWRKGLKAWSGDPAVFLDRERGRSEVFPWECVDAGVDREALWLEWERYKQGRMSPGCSPLGCERCPGCGMERQTGGQRPAPGG